MSFLAGLEAELVRRGVPRRARARIRDEYADHLACEPGCEARLGDPAGLARSFAADLAAQGARRATGEGFLALLITALALLAGQFAIQATTGYRPLSHGGSAWLWGLEDLIVLSAPQVAFAAGMLGAWRAWRRRGERELPDAEVALIRRRFAVANTAGILTCAGLLMMAVDYASRLPSWWAPMQGGAAGLALAALLAVRLRGRSARALAAGVAGPSGGLAADLPLAIPLVRRVALPLLARPVVAVALLTTCVFFAVTALGANAESSLVEGVERGGFEAVLVAGGITLAALAGRRRRTA